MMLGGQVIANMIRDGKLLRGALDNKVSKLFDYRVLSYGVGHAGYDIRLSTVFVAPRHVSVSSYPYSNDSVMQIVGTRDVGAYFTVADPKKLYDSQDGEWSMFSFHVPFLLGPNTWILGESVETFDMPNDVIGLVFGKSSYARAGLLVNVTPIEPGWKGKLVIELANLGPWPVKIYPGEGIAQVCFLYVEQPIPYGGRWQNQKSLAESFAGKNYPVVETIQEEEEDVEDAYYDDSEVDIEQVSHVEETVNSERG